MAVKVNPDGTFEKGVTDDDVIQPFQLDIPHLRGRMVKLGRVLDEILGKHNYPEPISQLLGECAILTLLLSAMLKYDGIFTLQVRGDGPVSFIVCDVTSKSETRGYAHFNAQKLNTLMKEDRQPTLSKLLGKGYITFTVDQGDNTDRYQGIVELYGETMVDCVHHYFNMSEQIKTGIRMATARQDDGRWRAGAVMVQKLPDESIPKERNPGSNTREDDWRRVMLLLQTCTDEELLSTELHSADILYRLFHEEEVRVFDPSFVKHKCRCSRQRVGNILMTLPPEDLEDCKKDGKIGITCEFCGKTYNFKEKDLEKIILEKKKS